MLQPSRQLEKIMKAEGPKKLSAGTSRKNPPGGRRCMLVSYILKTQWLFVSVCPELIEELAGASLCSDLKFGMRVEDVVSRRTTSKT